MGHGASSLTKAQKEEVSRLMQKVLDECKANGTSDADAQTKLTAEYMKLTQKYSKDSENAEPTKKKVVSVSKFEPPTQIQPKRKSSLGGYSSKGKPRTRRRSFDTAITKVKTAEALMSAIKDNMEKATELMNDQSAPTLKSKSDAAGEEVVDSWDSVTQQPFCDTCQMAFKSAAFLERHVKYSDLHVKNVKRKEAEVKAKEGPTEEEKAEAAESAKIAAEEAKVAVAAAEDKRKKLAMTQEEGKEYKLLYNGSKFYWRSQKTVDIDMYLHILPQIVEVIAFDPDKHKEVSRIYLRYTIIADILEQMIAADIDIKKKEMAQDKFNHGMTPAQELEMRDTITKNRVVTHILQRLQQDTVNLQGAVLYVQLSGDVKAMNPVVDNPPTVLLPVFMTRRRRTNAEEIQSTLKSLSRDQEEAAASNRRANSLADNKSLLENARKKAQRIATHVYDGARFIQQKKWYAHLPVGKRRFIKAVYLVMRRTEVAKVRAMLLEKYPALANSAKYQAHIASTGNIASSSAK